MRYAPLLGRDQSTRSGQHRPWINVSCRMGLWCLTPAFPAASAHLYLTILKTDVACTPHDFLTLTLFVSARSPCPPSFTPALTCMPRLPACAAEGDLVQDVFAACWKNIRILLFLCRRSRGCGAERAEFAECPDNVQC